MSSTIFVDLTDRFGHTAACHTWQLLFTSLYLLLLRYPSGVTVLGGELQTTT
jgi:hypothetical protein